MRHLDRSRPYGTICGYDPDLGDARYLQDGFAFRADGSLIQGADDATQEQKTVKPDDMRLKDNKALKVQMEAYGEEWQGVDHARKFLGLS